MLGRDFLMIIMVPTFGTGKRSHNSQFENFTDCTLNASQTEPERMKGNTSRKIQGSQCERTWGRALVGSTNFCPSSKGKFLLTLFWSTRRIAVTAVGPSCWALDTERLTSQERES